MRVVIVGTGYVGLVTGACLASVGHRVVCVEADRDRALRVARGETPIIEDGLPELVKDGVASGALSATDDLQAAAEGAEIAMICVGTPALADGGSDLSAVERAACQLGATLKGRGGFPVVTVKSTVPPGTTDTVVRRAVEIAGGGRAGEDFGLAMNPEFLSQGSAVRDFLAPDRIVVGAFDPRSARVLEDLYRPFPAPLLVMALREAEMVKYAANGLQATLISYANQIAALCEAIPGVDHATVMAAVHLDRMLDGPGGGRAGATRFLMGGIGFGGSCFPKDLRALAALARERGVAAPLIEAVSALNDARIEAVARRLEAAIGTMAGRRLTVLGLAFKPGTDDLRESPGLRLARRLAGCGADVTVHDPLPIVRQRARSLLPADIAIADSAEAALTGADAAVIATAWPDYRDWDWTTFAARMARPLVLDGRLLLDGLDLPRWLTVLRAGAGPDTSLPRE